MVFSSIVFLFYFLPLVLAVYYLIPYDKDPKPGKSPYWMRNLWLTVMGYVFYSWFEPWFVIPMMFTNVFDFVCGLYLGREGMSRRHRLTALWLSMAMNLGLLAVFKYGVFTQENLNNLLVAVLGINLLGDALRDALDPTLKL